MLAGVGDCGFFVEQSFLDLLSITEGLFLPLPMLLHEAPINIQTLINHIQFIFKHDFVHHAGICFNMAMEGENNPINNQFIIPFTNVFAEVDAERTTPKDATRIVRCRKSDREIVDEPTIAKLIKSERH